MPRAVTEQDLRAPEFREGSPSDYEFRADGRIVLKARWENGIHAIACILFGARAEFEIPDLVERVRALAKDEQDWELLAETETTDLPDSVQLKLEDGSILNGCLCSGRGFTWRGLVVEGALAWRPERDAHRS